MIVAICAECGEELDPEVPEAHVCFEILDATLSQASIVAAFAQED